jgi:long-chain acyl-CoA synthetase
MEFFRILVGAGCTVHEGYGMTETTGGISITYEEDITVTGHVGGPLPVCEVKLVDVVDMGYLHSDSVHNQTRRCDGRGEICVRGPGVFQGYYKDPAATAAVLDSDGWLHTGDIGLWTPFGQLAIIDRKKNLLKLSQGEYVAVERVENVITSSCPLVAQAFVHGVSTENYIVAVVVPDEEAVKASGINTDSSLLKERILADIQRASREAGLHGFETVRSIWVEPANSASLWTPENGLMTPTFKIKRQAIATRFATQLASMYSPPRSKL